MARCRTCKALIFWLKTAQGNTMPVDFDPAIKPGDKFNAAKHTSHFATCPQADQHRSRDRGT